MTDNDLMVNSQNTQMIQPDFSNAATQLLVNQAQQLELAYNLAEKFCSTDLVPKNFRNKPADGAVAIQWGAEIGLQPLQAMQNIAVINGNPSLWGDSLIALVRGSGLCEKLTTEYIDDNGNVIVRVTTKRKGEEEEYREFSWNDAVVAGLADRDTYKNHPKRMLQNRARSHVLRDVYADILKGFKVREIEEEDKDQYGDDFSKQRERNITPRPKKSAFSALNKKPKQAKKEKVVDVNVETGETNSPKFDKWKVSLLDCTDEKSLSEVGNALAIDKELTDVELFELRKIYSQQKANF